MKITTIHLHIVALSAFCVGKERRSVDCIVAISKYCNVWRRVNKYDSY